MVLNVISGLGADHRVFQRVDFSGFEVNHIKWIDNLTNESLKSYAKRLSEQLITNKPYAILGLSFGGIITSEMLNFIEPKPIKSIILSSVRNQHELPEYIKRGRKIPLHKLVPTFFFNFKNPIIYKYFGLKSERQKELLNQIMADSNPIFIKWAINEIVNWQQETTQSNTVHIHGNKDHVFPIENCHPEHIITNGSHFSVFTHATEVTRIICLELN